MLRPRIGVRGLMVAVAVLAVVLGFLVERRRRFEGIAGLHRREQMAILPIIISIGSNPAIAERAAWVDRMVEKYDRAADRPWMPVGPDPPEPAPFGSGLDVRAAPE